MGAKVLIVGGGVAALEVAIALRDLAGDRVEVEICSSREDFLYRPYAVTSPFELPRAMRFDLADLAKRCGASYRRGTVDAVDEEAQLVRTREGDEIRYDYVVIASGARMLNVIPGAVTFWGIDDDRGLRDVVRDLRERSVRRVAFAIPGGSTWALPLYELALLASEELSKQGEMKVSLVIVTPEDSPLSVFGRSASEGVAELLAARGIEVAAGETPIRFADRELMVAPDGRVDADAVLSLPRIEGQRIAGVPANPEGFVQADEHGRVHGMRRVYAAGDVTTFPVKQGGIATQQADVVAESIAAEVGAGIEADPFDPVLRGVLWTGTEPLYLFCRLAGGYGETSTASQTAPWGAGEEDKVVGRYLTPFMAEVRAAI